jgi:hypothetical protein
MSEVVLVRKNNVKQNLWVLNNPFGARIDLRFANEAGSVQLQLVNANGSVVATKQLSVPGGNYSWQVPEGLSKGVYVLRAETDGQVFSFKLVK